MQYIYGVAFVRLGDIAQFAKARIGAKTLNKENYVGVDNLLADKKGKTISEYVPQEGNAIAYQIGDILVGNIRPYLKKIWLADRDGGTNGDVLVFQPQIDLVTSKYLYHVLAMDKFFLFDMQYAKGAKMPRGNKEEILKFEFPLPPLEVQAEIVETLDKFDKLCNDLSGGLPAEIQARQKQYEYYRDKLLTFN